LILQFARSIVNN